MKKILTKIAVVFVALGSIADDVCGNNVKVCGDYETYKKTKGKSK